MTPDPKPPKKHPPLMDHSFATLGWLHRAAQAVGSHRFVETMDRVRFYLDRASEYAVTPGERSVVAGLSAAFDDLVMADLEARTVLTDGCLGMDAVEATEFVEMIESGEENFPEV